MLSRSTFERDRVGHTLEKQDLAGDRTLYAYDPLYRLLSSDTPDCPACKDWTYTYDAVGNRTTSHHGWRSYTYSPSGNRLLEIRTGTTVRSQYEYDPAGNLRVERNERGLETLYDYDQKNQLRSAVTKTGTGFERNDYRYDPLGYRIEKTDREGTRRYLLEGEHTEAVYDDLGRLVARYLRGAVIDEVVNVVQVDGAGRLESLTLHHDEVGSVTSESSHAGDAVAAHDYAPFGASLTSAGAVESRNRLQYTGRERDLDTGLYYYRARYYDPEIGRFLSEDPLGFRAGVNFYAYVENNPVNFNDPLGLEPSIYAFPIERDPGSGVVRGGFYIQRETALGVLRGDARQFDAGATAEQFRIAVNLDFEAGTGYVQANDTTVALGPFSRTFDPNPLNGPGSPSTVGVNANRYGVEVTIHSPNGVDRLGLGPGIDGRIVVIPNGSSPASGFAMREGFPSFQLVQDQGGATRTLANEAENAGLFGPFAVGTAGGADRYVPLGAGGGGAGGGFVLYPSQPNLNMSRAVYGK